MAAASHYRGVNIMEVLMKEDDELDLLLEKGDVAFEEPVEPHEQAVENPELDNPQEPVQARRSDRPRRSTANSDYMYLQEADFDIGDEADPTSFKEAMESHNANKWREVMLNELESMKNNQVWELVEPHKSQKLLLRIGSTGKGDLKKEHCPKNKEEEDEMRNKPYASVAYMLIYKRTKNLELIGYADANLGKVEDDYISTSGFIFKMARAAVAWKSAKQTGVSSSTMFSEYIACYEATSHIVWLRNFIKDIKVVDSIS
ncbi:unnamed protein product [Prunus brigantina]